MFLIYGQTLTWVAIYFSPMAQVIFNVLLVAIFYVKLASLKFNCSVSTKPWRAGQSQTIFFILTFISLLGTFIYFFYIIYNNEPSVECGPFILDENPFDVFQGIYIFKPGVAGCVLVAFL